MSLTRPELLKALRGMKKPQSNRLYLASKYRENGRNKQVQRLAKAYNSGQVEITKLLKAINNNAA